MSYNSNPFLRRMSEKTVSDQEFVHLFSPKILDQLPIHVLDGSVKIFSSPPGGGKTTLLRVFTPDVLRAIWDGRQTDYEAYGPLEKLGAIDPVAGPNLLGVMLSCASGYADLPPGATIKQEGIFRALLNCRIVLKTLRSICTFLRVNIEESIDAISIDYSGNAADLISIPTNLSIIELIKWAEALERKIYFHLDDFSGSTDEQGISHIRFEGILWIDYLKFIYEGKEIALKKLVMIDDLHKLRKKQRLLLMEELCEMRSGVPIWLSERNIALGATLLSQGARNGREMEEIKLQELWGPVNRSKFNQFAQNILDRRLKSQKVIPVNTEFSRYLRNGFNLTDSKSEISQGVGKIIESLSHFKINILYKDWLEGVSGNVPVDSTFEFLLELFVTRILIERNEQKKQFSLDLSPLPNKIRESKDKSDVRAAAEFLIHKQFGVPYFFGIERLCAVASSNVEELLTFAAGLYEELQAKSILRKSLPLSPQEQDKIIRNTANAKHSFIPRSHTYGTKAQKLLDAIGVFCQERTYRLNAPFAPGVTGIRLSNSELEYLQGGTGVLKEQREALRDILSESVAENLLLMRKSAASTNRPAGTVFYLSRSLCAHYRLPLGFGGWNEVSVKELIDWIDKTPTLKAVL